MSTTLHLSDKSPIKNKPYGRCSKTELLSLIEYLLGQNHILKYNLYRTQLKYEHLPIEYRQ